MRKEEKIEAALEGDASSAEAAGQAVAPLCSVFRGQGGVGDWRRGRSGEASQRVDIPWAESHAQNPYSSLGSQAHGLVPLK